MSTVEGLTVTSGGIPIADSKNGGGVTAAAPAGGTQIGATGALAAGLYKVQVAVWQSGTPDANLLNASVRHGTTIFAGSVPTTNTPVVLVFDRVTVGAGETLNVVVGGTAGGAGSVYNCVIVATQIG